MLSLETLKQARVIPEQWLASPLYLLGQFFQVNSVLDPLFLVSGLLPWPKLVSRRSNLSACCLWLTSLLGTQCA